MALKKISELAAISALDDDDIMVIVEDGTTKKVTVAELRGVLDDPIIGILGVPDTSHEFGATSLAALTALGSPDAEDAHTTLLGHYYINDNTVANSCMGRYVAPPSTPWTAVVRLSDHNVRANFNLAGMFVGEATPGQLDSISISYGANQIDALNWASPTDAAPPSLGIATPRQAGPFYFAIRANSGTDVDFLYSSTGVLWTKHLDSRNPGFTIGSVGIFIASINSSGLSAFFDYIRIWNSAKSFPGVAA